MITYLKLILVHGIKRGAIAGIILPALSVLFGLVWAFLEPGGADINMLDVLRYFSESFGIMTLGMAFTIPLSCLVALSLSLIFGLISYFVFRGSNSEYHTALAKMMVVAFSIFSATVTILAVNAAFRAWFSGDLSLFNHFSLTGALLAIAGTIKVGSMVEIFYSEAMKTAS